MASPHGYHVRLPAAPVRAVAMLLAGTAGAAGAVDYRGIRRS
ncbi:MAG TPA: hypothetical protein VGQ24_03665 [Gemmatimonadales bacterium]|nr:hypothetical protein [Gemmatimonadales bacterium]